MLAQQCIQEAERETTRLTREGRTQAEGPVRSRAHMGEQV